MAQAVARVLKDSRAKKPLADLAYEAIYRNIISLDFEPGSVLDEKELMAKLGFGRTPIREALLRLSSDMMVESNPSKGFLVRPITLQNTKAAFEALEIMELGVVSLAVKNNVEPFLAEMRKAHSAVERAVDAKDLLGLVESNYEFHMHFYRSSGNSYLVGGLYQVRLETKRLAYLSYSNEVDPMSSLHDHYESVKRDHCAIIDLLSKKDEPELKKVVQRHIQAFQHRIIAYLTT